MFRRKEENEGAPEGATEATPTAAQTPVQAQANEPAAPQAATPVASNPTAPTQATRPVTEATRPAATAASFRPTPPSARIAEPRGPITATPTATSASNSSDKNAKGNRRILTVGNDILLKGEIATCDRLVIEGKVDATLNDVHTVEIAETGSFKGTAQIEDAEISGLFEGELVVKNRLVIYSTGIVRGKISYGEIEIERGGELSGEIKLGGTAEKAQNRAA